MTRRPLTDLQLRVLVWIKDFISTNGYPPTRREIATGFGWRSSNAAQEHLERLDNKGWIELNSKVSRGIRVLGPVLDRPES